MGLVTDRTRWLASREEDGETAVRIGRRGAHLVAEWPTIGTLTALSDGSEAEFVPAENADARDVEKVRLGAARALVERLRGKIALHASAVALGERAFIFLGTNHAGKSSLAAYLCAHGASLLADDIAIIDDRDGRLLVEPSERHHWLSADFCDVMGVHISPDDEKTPVEAPQRAATPTPIASIVSLEFADGPTQITRSAGLSIMDALLRSVVRFVVDDDDVIAREARDLISIAGRVPFHTLKRPRDLKRMHESERMLRAILENQS
jgi:hypothetical protein